VIGERSNPDHYYAAAVDAYQAGDRDRAARYCDLALEQSPDRADVHALLEKLFLHGESYAQLLERLHRHLRPRTYVEIGVETGAPLRLAQPGTRAVGVDPRPVIGFPLPDGARVFTESSDDFFARRDVRAELGGLPVELAFIDGMHHFEYALRDFMNL